LILQNAVAIWKKKNKIQQIAVQKKILLQQIAFEISYKNKILQAVLFFHMQVFVLRVWYIPMQFISNGVP